MDPERRAIPMDFEGTSPARAEQMGRAIGWYGRLMTAASHDRDHSEVHPALPWIVRWWWLWAIVALATGGFTIAAADGFPIVDLEFAWTVERADAATRRADLDSIRSAILWDFVFIFFYAVALSTGALWARHQFAGAVGYGLGIVVAVGGVVAGVFDIVENLSMLGYINRWAEWSGWIALAGVAAVPKFVLALAGVLYVVTGMVLFLVRRRSR